MPINFTPEEGTEQKINFRFEPTNKSLSPPIEIDKQVIHKAEGPTNKSSRRRKGKRKNSTTRQDLEERLIDVYMGYQNVRRLQNREKIP